MTKRISMAVVPLLAAIVFGGCRSTTPNEGANPHERTPSVDAKGWESSPPSTAGKDEDMAAAHARLQELTSKIDELNARMKALKESRASNSSAASTEPALAPAPAPEMHPSTGAPTPAVDSGRVRSALAKAGLASLSVSGRRDGSVCVTLPGSDSFRPGRATLMRGARSKLKILGAALERQLPGARLEVDGYTDSDPIRKSHWKNNQQLSEARARAVAEYLVTHAHWPANRVESLGFGSANPVAPNTTSAGKAKNRRVEIVIRR